MQKAAGGFLGLPEDDRDTESAALVVLPIPYEQTVSYGAGTRDGPAAIIAASQQVELYDPETDSEPAAVYGVRTLQPLEGLMDQQTMLDRVSHAARAALGGGRLLLSLGGEHSITPPLVRGAVAAAGEPLTVVQIDAHADLRDSYQGTRYSHACAMRRVLEETPAAAIQLGIRSYSAEEAAFLRECGGRVSQWSARAINRAGTAELLTWLTGAVKGKKVYLTIDVDGLDPSVVPATGTPEPGGLGWDQTLDILCTIAGSSWIVAMDCVELAPRPGLHMAEFAVARLLHETVNRIMAGRAAARG
jgi:agmatinase